MNGGAYNDDVLAAVEDAIRLNADVVNLSLGSPSGFTDESDTVNKIYGKILESDMVVAIAAGNSASAAAYNGFGTNLNLTEDPDNGIVSSPGTYIGATCVASLENTRLMLNYLVVGEEKVVFSRCRPGSLYLPVRKLSGVCDGSGLRCGGGLSGPGCCRTGGGGIPRFPGLYDEAAERRQCRRGCMLGL